MPYLIDTLLGHHGRAFAAVLAMLVLLGVAICIDLSGVKPPKSDSWGKKW